MLQQVVWNFNQLFNEPGKSSKPSNIMNAHSNALLFLLFGISLKWASFITLDKNKSFVRAFTQRNLVFMKTSKFRTTFTSYLCSWACAHLHIRRTNAWTTALLYLDYITEFKCKDFLCFLLLQHLADAPIQSNL